ncbi:MAG: TIGR02757 family protein [Rhodothermales bacterium]|nr:TIGR02757 family protein [Rhodothermales bacterium]
MTSPNLRAQLDAYVTRFETPDFIAADPISVPHAFDDPADREAIGFVAALLAWGRRATILNKLEDLCQRMQMRPATFFRAYDDARDGASLDGFAHRTFNARDARALATALRTVLERHGSLEAAYAFHLSPDAPDVGPAIQGVADELLAALDGTDFDRARLARHLPRPSSGSACKRVAMYLRWMVRPGPVDFGQWTRIDPSKLVLPLDVHSGRVARKLGLLSRPQDDWRAVQELTAACRALAPDDPARYDYAFFGAGVAGEL